MHFLLPREVVLYQREAGDPVPEEAQSWSWHVHEGFNKYF
jgi:hypothetical protein